MNVTTTTTKQQKQKQNKNNKKRNKYLTKSKNGKYAKELTFSA